MLAKLKNIYISPELAEKLDQIQEYPITAVAAPAGHGKSSVLEWWRDRYSKAHPDALMIEQRIKTGSASDFWQGFCNAFRFRPELREQIMALGLPTEPEARGLLLSLLIDAMEQRPQSEAFYLLDDLHVLQSPVVNELFLFLCEHVPKRVHIVVASRVDPFTDAAYVSVLSRLWEIGEHDLRLRPQDVREYVRRSGQKLNAGDMEQLVARSEGWPIVVYLLLKRFLESGVWGEVTDDVSPLIDEAVYMPLPERQRRFMMLLGLPDEFTLEQAEHLWPEGDAGELLHVLTRQNALIRRAGTVYRYHSLLRKCMREKFERLPQEKQDAQLYRMGKWEAQTGNYYRAQLYYERCGAWPELVAAIYDDRALSIAGLNFSDMLRWCRDCPEAALKARPDTLLVLMRKLFSFGQMPEMLRMKQLLDETLAEDTRLTEEERNNIQGECQLIMSFLAYNDIRGMSEYHRRACALMSRTSITIDPHGYWAFGAPSILMMFHRESGKLDEENAAMRTCMPYYYQVTNEHGNGAEYAMQCETDYLRGNMGEAAFHYQFATNYARRREQYSIFVPAQLVKMQMLLYAGDFSNAIALLNDTRELLRENRQYLLLYTMDLADAWLYSLLGQHTKLPEWLADEHRPSPMLRPALPMQEVVRNQTLLVAGEYAVVAAREKMVLELCREYHYLLCEVYTQIQLAAAYDQLGKRKRAMEHLSAALDEALPDGLILPFVLECDYITIQLRELAARGVWKEEIAVILERCAEYRPAKVKIIREHFRDFSVFGLTGRELEIARLAAERKTNKEIAEELELSEGTVKTHLKRIFSKLDISGNARNKRTALAQMFSPKDTP